MHGVIAPPVTPELLDRLAALLKAGKSHAEIGAALGRSKSAISGLVHRHFRGLEPAGPARRRLSDAERAEALRRYAETAESTSAIGQRFGVTGGTISDLAREAGATRAARRGFGGAVTALRVKRKRGGAWVDEAAALPDLPGAATQRGDDAPTPPLRVDPPHKGEGGDLMARLFTPEAAPPLNVALVDLRRRDCRWPVAGEGAATLFCAHPAGGGASYCAAHRARARGAGTISEQKALKAPGRLK